MPKTIPLQTPFSSERARSGAPAFEILEEDARRDRLQRKRTAWTLAVAAAAHLLILLLNLPESAAEQVGTPERGPVYVVQQVRFQPPAPRPEKKVAKRKAKRIPIPDPTPDAPEPILEDEIEVELELDFVDGAEIAVEIPDAPPGVGPHPAAAGALQIGNGVERPLKIFAPKPAYPEAARASRIQGTVLLQVVVTAEGVVVEPKVLKGLPLGLSESALETVKTWTFKPATKDGRPVAVFLILTVNFNLQ